MAMRTFAVTLLGVEISFWADADPQQVETARALLEERFGRFAFHGRQMSREKMLMYVALGFADDLLQSERHVGEMRERLRALFAKIKDTASAE